MKNVGGFGVPNRISFSWGTMPPPLKRDTSLKVCVSPPRFSTVSESPALTFTRFGEKCHAPANLFCCSCCRKTSTGVPPFRRADGSMNNSLNDGLHASLAKTLDGFAAATGTNVRTAAAATATTPVALKMLRTDSPFLPLRLFPIRRPASTADAWSRRIAANRWLRAALARQRRCPSGDTEISSCGPVLLAVLATALVGSRCRGRPSRRWRSSSSASAFRPVGPRNRSTRSTSSAASRGNQALCRRLEWSRRDCDHCHKQGAQTGAT